MSGTPAIRRATTADASEVTNVLAVAFLDGPVAEWLLPDREMRAKLSPDYFRVYVDLALEHGHVDVVDDLSAVALWFHRTADATEPDPAEYERRMVEALGELVVRAAMVEKASMAHYPADRGEHHHLAFLGVLPERQSHGLGSALLEHHHAELAKAGLPAYLEANQVRNRDLYLRHGYESLASYELPDGPPIFPMWRPAH